MPLLPLSELERLAPVFRGKAGNAFAGALLRMTGVARLEELYAGVEGKKGPEASEAFLKEIGASYAVTGEEHLSCRGTGPFITVSNHPLGSLDGIILIDYMEINMKILVCDDVVFRILDKSKHCVLTYGKFNESCRSSLLPDFCELSFVHREHC